MCRGLPYPGSHCAISVRFSGLRWSRVTDASLTQSESSFGLSLFGAKIITLVKLRMMFSWENWGTSPWLLWLKSRARPPCHDPKIDKSEKCPTKLPREASPFGFPFSTNRGSCKTRIVHSEASVEYLSTHSGVWPILGSRKRVVSILWGFPPSKTSN